MQQGDPIRIAAFLTSNSGAEAGLTTLYNENGETVPLEVPWARLGLAARRHA